MKLIYLLAFFSIFLIAACTQTAITGEVTVEEKSPCFNIICNENQNCVNGICICNEGYKKCGEKCVKETDCCTDKDCNKNEICKNNKCVFSCETLLCPYNQVCDEDLKKCICRPDTLWCNYQKKCLKRESCCDNYDCKANKKCTITTSSVNICFEGEQKACKYVGENSFVYFKMYGNRYKFELEKIYANDEIKYSIDDAPLKRLKLGQRIKLAPSLYLYFQEIKEIGGGCGY